MGADPHHISLESSSTDAEVLGRTHIGQWGDRTILCRCDRCRKRFKRARRVVHDHIKKWGRWNPKESPHDVPHYTVAPRLLRDYYKRARAEAEEEESHVRQRMTEAVDDLEGLPT
jgi:hypothetical protein